MDCSTDCLQGDIRYPFALDEVIAKRVGEGSLPPVVHLWRHRRAFVLGLRDRRLPQALEMMNVLEEKGFSVTVRNSGGAAVPLDPGVMNISLICPNPTRNLEFHQDFELMYEIIQGALQQLGHSVKKGEIVGSYCPGDYDLSVNGQKFCGIAQRRQIGAYIVQAFVVVTGDGQERARLVKSFYEGAASYMDKDYVQVEMDSMGSLSQLLDIHSVHSFREGLQTFLVEKGGKLGNLMDEPIIQEEIQRKMVELKDRYERRT